jgi:PAS domain S-box-containing protein
MKKHSENLSDAAWLRQKAEEQLSRRKQEVSKMVSESDMLKLIHELEVHQIELEMQNNELTMANHRANEATEKYEELYDFAPSGYFTLSRQGKILEMNLHCAQMLGKERSLLINSRFDSFIQEESRGVFTTFLEKIFQGNKNAICDVPLNGKENNYLHLHLTGIISENKEQCRVTAVDITKYKKAEQDLLIAKERAEESEERYKSLHNASFGGIAIHDKGIILECNQGLSEMTGYSLEELIGMDGLLLIAPEHREMVMNKIVTGYEKPYEANGLRKNGDIFPMRLEARNVPYKGKNARTVEFRDITESKKAEKAIKDRENLLNKVFEILPIGLWFADANGRLIRGNPAGVKIWGAEPTVSIEEYGVFKARRYPSGMEIRPDDWALAHTIREGVTIEDEQLEIDAFDGKKKIILNYTAPVVDEQGNIQGAIVVNQDITLRKMAEELLQKKSEEIANHNKILSQINQELIAAKEIAEENEKRFNLAMNASNDGLFDWNLETNEIYYSPGWKKMLGYEDHELPNDFSVWENTTNAEDVKKSWELQQELIAKQVDRFVMEFKMKHKKGHWVDILSRAEAIFNDNGKAVRIVGTHTDISGRKQAEKALLEKIDELERFSRLTVGREITMVELKKEVNDLLNQLGKENKYRIVE